MLSGQLLGHPATCRAASPIFRCRFRVWRYVRLRQSLGLLAQSWQAIAVQLTHDHPIRLKPASDRVYGGRATPEFASATPPARYPTAR